MVWFRKRVSGFRWLGTEIHSKGRIVGVAFLVVDEEECWNGRSVRLAWTTSLRRYPTPSVSQIDLKFDEIFLQPWRYVPAIESTR